MGKTIKRYMKLYRVLIAQFFKVILQSKVDFLMGLLGFFFTQILGLMFLYLVFRQIPDIYGWSFEEIIFIYGFAQIPRGLDHLLTDNIWMIAWRMVLTGDFDRYMLRPMNVFFQVISEKLQPDAVGELLIGIVLIIRAVTNGVVQLNLQNVCLFFASVIAGAVIYTSVKLFFASFSFWMKQSGPVLQMAYEMADFSKYPTEIYNKIIRFIITWILPFAFVAYLPARFFLRGGSVWVIAAECGISVVFWVIAYGTFQLGIRAYESAGN